MAVAWESVRDVAVNTALAYLFLLFVIRIAGKRSLGRMSNFDLVVTYALGALLATMAVSDAVPLTRGIVAVSVLFLLEYVLEWLAARSPWVSRVLNAPPTVLMHQGQFLHVRMRRQRVTEAEILQAVRDQGIPSLAHVEAVVLEGNGSLVAIRRPDEEQPDAV